MKKREKNEECSGVKRIFLGFLCLFAGSVVVFSGMTFFDSEAAQADSDKYVQGEIIVKFKHDLSQKDEKKFLDKNNFSSMKKVADIHSEKDKINNKISARGIDRIFLVKSEKNFDILKITEKLNKNSDIEYAEPNFKLNAFETIPNDVSFPELWGMHNTGQDGGVEDADIDAPEAWDRTTGSGDVVVAVIDTGIDYNHPDLAQNIWNNPSEIAGDGIDNDGNGFIDDIHGWDFYNNDSDPMDDRYHGTHCAGTIGAVGNNGIGVAGVNWNIKMMPVKFLSASGSGTTEGAIQSIVYAAVTGADIMSNSWGGGDYSMAEEDAISFANDMGILFVAAAGNSGSNNDLIANYPSNYDIPNVIAVAATDYDDAKADFSNFGLGTVDLGAPGVYIYSTVLNGEYAYLSGTSMATPHVSGVAGLIKSKYPNANASEMKMRILNNVDVVPGLVGKTVTGGRLNAFTSLDGDDTAPAKIENLSVASSDYTSITLSWTAPGDDGTSGTATSYDLRYSTAQITEDNWDEAVQFESEPVPGAGGTSETATIQNLDYNSTHYFAIKTYDNVGNASEISNILFASVLPDITAPANVQDLSMASNQYEAVVLSWTAPGDDGTFGTAASYDLRYSTSQITEENWDEAIQAGNEPVPSVSGTAESVEIKNLGLNTAYYFAIKTTDKAGNVSELSNVAVASTKDAVIIYEDNMESEINGWVVSGTDGFGGEALWHQSQRRSNSPITSWYYGIEETGCFDSGVASTGYLTSADIDLTGLQNSILSLAYFQDINLLSYGDSSSVEISKDGGLTWTTLASLDNTNEKWTVENFDLANYSGSVIKIRIRLYSDATEYCYNEGLYVDDIKVYGEYSNGNISPVAEAGSYQVGIIGLNMTFDGSVSYDSDGSIVSYNWDFGDGTYGTGRVAYHTYTEEGTFYAKLTVADNNGGTAFDSATRVIEYKENVEISKTQYSKSQKILSVVADSSVFHEYVTLTLVGYGDMTYNAETGQYYIDTYSAVNPLTVTVVSNLGGKDTESVASTRVPR
ncbi:MAG: subtilase family serine protease [Parcubacteria group bacterium Athens0714_25]|nr:MAG: subtilase family serine protease [Parcubacteria group bacterium Athens0714_25]